MTSFANLKCKQNGVKTTPTVIEDDIGKESTFTYFKVLTIKD